MKELIITENKNEKQICFLENGILKEYYKENNNKKRLEGNIYIGKVTDVLPGMQAAFVNIGQDKNAFLHIRDILSKKSNITGNKEENLDKYNIKDYIKQGQSILVQVKKDSNNIKGSKVSANIQVVGRFVILLPENDFITISQKIEDELERKRLLETVKEVKKEQKIGVIIRTAAENKDKQIIQKDYERTLQKLNRIQEEYEKQDNISMPKILYQEDSILEKILLDIADNNLEKISVNTKQLKEQIEKILKDIYNNELNVEIELVNENLEDKYELKSQIEKMSNRKIWLKCGGFITIDKTEALTAIDVNSGKFTGKEKLEKTVLKVNKEASIEIAKQIRLRDIGGIIIIDYIDMEEENSKNEVINVLKDSLKEDRAKTQIMQFTKLNLLEMTRKHMFSEEE